MVSCCFPHSFKITLIPQTIIPVRSPSQPVTVLWSGSADMPKVLYIRCLNGQVPEDFEIWALADYGVHEVQLYARVKLRSEFRKDTFELSSSMRNNPRLLSWVVEL